MNEAQLSEYTVTTRVKLALRSDPDQIVVYAQHGDLGPAKQLAAEAGVEIIETDRLMCDGLREAYALREVSPARYSYYMRLLEQDNLAEMPQCNRALIEKANAQRKIIFIPGDSIHKIDRSRGTIGLSNV